MTTVSAIFKKRSEADRAFDQLEYAGFSQSQISLVMSEDTRNSYIKEINDKSKADEGAATGAGLGGLAGAVAGMLLAAGAVAIPGLNIVVAGTFVSALAGLGAGALTGGVVGGLIGAGIPEHEAKLYAEEIERGNFLVSVQTETAEEEAKARKVFSQNNADSIAA
jgi:hypothetical protein